MTNQSKPPPELLARAYAMGMLTKPVEWRTGPQWCHGYYTQEFRIPPPPGAQPHPIRVTLVDGAVQVTWAKAHCCGRCECVL